MRSSNVIISGCLMFRRKVSNDRNFSSLVIAAPSSHSDRTKRIGRLATSSQSASRTGQSVAQRERHVVEEDQTEETSKPYSCSGLRSRSELVEDCLIFAIRSSGSSVSSP